MAFAVKVKQKKVAKAGDAASDDYSEPATSRHRLNVKSAAVLANQVPRFPQTVNLCHLSSETACLTGSHFAAAVVLLSRLLTAVAVEDFLWWHWIDPPGEEAVEAVEV